MYFLQIYSKSENKIFRNHKEQNIKKKSFSWILNSYFMKYHPFYLKFFYHETHSSYLSKKKYIIGNNKKRNDIKVA